VTGGTGRPSSDDLDRTIARLLTVGTYGSIALLAVGFLLMIAARITPLGGAPRFEPSILVDDLVHLRAQGFIWLGLVCIVATPSARVIASLVGYVRGGERSMVIVGVLILVVIGLSVGLARGLGG
jgi:uncharacterized membrane protein